MSSAGVGCWWPAPSRRTSSNCGTGPSVRRDHSSEAHTAGTQELLQVRQGEVGSGGRAVGNSHDGRLGLVRRRRGSLLRQPAAQAARFSLAVFEPGVGPGITIGGLRCLIGHARGVPGRRRVDDAVFALRPDYRALLLAVDGLVPGPSDQASEELLQAAESAAREALGGLPVEDLPHVASWREAYRAFGAKPQRTRNSLEALLRRAGGGLPRVNRLTDLYNAISVLHQIPLGGEDLTRYSGPTPADPRQRRRAFDTIANGVAVIEHPDPGEVVWCDEAGVTCRRWNWRQARRTQLREDTTAALFILDALDPVADAALHAAADDLLTHLTRSAPTSGPPAA